MLLRKCRKALRKIEGMICGAAISLNDHLPLATALAGDPLRQLLIGAVSLDRRKSVAAASTSAQARSIAANPRPSSAASRAILRKHCSQTTPCSANQSKVVRVSPAQVGQAILSSDVVVGIARRAMLDFG